jgi:hypothetical protein
LSKRQRDRKYIDENGDLVHETEMEYYVCDDQETEYELEEMMRRIEDTEHELESEDSD